MAAVISDAGRIPRWYSLTIGAFCCSLVILVVATMHGGATSRGTVGAILAVLAAGYFWGSRKTYRKTLARSLPRRVLGRWLVSLPGWLMIAATLGCWLIPLGLAALVLLIRPALGNWHGFLVSVGPIVVIGAMGQAAGWLELRKRGPGLTPATGEG